MKAIIIDIIIIALDLSLSLRRFQGVELSETHFIQGLGIAVSSPTLLLPCNYPLGSPDEMLQAAGVDDKSYSVRHGMEEHRGLPACLLLRARHIRVPRPALSRETLLSTIAVAMLKCKWVDRQITEYRPSIVRKRVSTLATAIVDSKVSRERAGRGTRICRARRSKQAGNPLCSSMPCRTE